MTIHYKINIKPIAVNLRKYKCFIMTIHYQLNDSPSSGLLIFCDDFLCSSQDPAEPQLDLSSNATVDGRTIVYLRRYSGPRYALIDSTMIKVHRNAAGAKRGTQNQAIGKFAWGLATKVCGARGCAGTWSAAFFFQAMVTRASALSRRLRTSTSSLSDLAQRAGLGRIFALIRPFFVAGWGRRWTISARLIGRLHTFYRHRWTSGCLRGTWLALLSRSLTGWICRR
jgi:hypothetical protein